MKRKRNKEAANKEAANKEAANKEAAGGGKEMLVFGELKMTHSTVLSRDGRPFVAVMIERGKDVAEGTIPECRITLNNGFSSEEVAELEAYLEEHRKEIIEAAKGISTLSNLLR